MNAVISETIKAAILGSGMQILEILAHRMFVSSVCLAPPDRPQATQNYKF